MGDPQRPRLVGMPGKGSALRSPATSPMQYRAAGGEGRRRETAFVGDRRVARRKENPKKNWAEIRRERLLPQPSGLLCRCFALTGRNGGSGLWMAPNPVPGRTEQESLSSAERQAPFFHAAPAWRLAQSSALLRKPGGLRRQRQTIFLSRRSGRGIRDSLASPARPARALCRRRTRRSSACRPSPCTAIPSGR